MNLLRAEGSAKALFLRFAAPVLAAYLLHAAVWTFAFVAEQIVLSLVTRTLNRLAELFGSYSFIDQEMVSVRYLAPEIAYGFIPLILGLFVGCWVLRRRRKAPQQPLQAAQSN